MIVNTSDWITSSTVLDALDYVLLRLGGHQLTRVINQAPRKADLKALESNLPGQRIAHHVTLPQDERLRQMLDSGTYVCERLERRTRTSVKHLALAVADHPAIQPLAEPAARTAPTPRQHTRAHGR